MPCNSHNYLIVNISHWMTTDMDDKPLISQDISTFSTLPAPQTYSTVFGTTMNLLNSVLGAGVLSIANSFTFCGILPSIVILTVSASLSYLSAYMIVKTNEIARAESLPALTTLALGKNGSFVIAASSVLFCYSCMTAYIIMSAEIVQSWLSLVNIKINGFWDRAIFVLIYSVCIPVVLTFPRQIGFLSAISFACFLALVIYTISIIYKGITILPVKGVDPTCETSVLSFKVFNSLSIYSLALALTVVMIPILQKMEPNTLKKLMASGIAFFLSFIIVLVPGVIGYLLFGENSKPVILSNFDDKDKLFIIVKAAYFIVLVASYPVMGLALMGVTSRSFYHHDLPQTLPFGQRIVCLLVVNVVPIAIGMFLPNVRPAMAIGGALGGGLSNFVFPPLIWISLSRKRWFSFSNILCILFILFGILSSSVSTYEAVLDALTSFKKK